MFKSLQLIIDMFSSRKFVLICWVLFTAIVVLLVPPLIFHIVILSESGYVSLVSICLTTYFAAHLTDKKLNSPPDESVITKTTQETKAPSLSTLSSSVNTVQTTKTTEAPAPATVVIAIPSTDLDQDTKDAIDKADKRR